MVATLAQQLYTMMVQTRLTAPISVKQFNQRLSHFSADDLLTTLSDFFCRTTQELKSWRDGCRRQLETMDQEKQTPPPFSRVFYFLSVCLPLQEDTLEKKALKQLYLISYQGCICLSKAVRTFLYWSCFIRDLLSVLLLLCLFFVLLFSLTTNQLQQTVAPASPRSFLLFKRSSSSPLLLLRGDHCTSL